MTRVSIVIPVYDGARLTMDCLDALIEQDLGAEIVVVDDASSDETSLMLETYAGKITRLANPDNQGYAVSCNRGVAASSGELVVLLNNDTVPHPGWLRALVDHLDGHPRAAIVGAKLLYPDGRIQHAGVAFNTSGYPYHLYVGFPSDHPATNRSRPFQAVTAACMLVRRTVFDELGGFDEGFVNSAEDVDLCLRAGALGHEVHYCAESVLTHVESATRGRDIQRQSELLYASRWKDRVRHDELEYMIEDRLIEIDYGHLGRLTLSVDPIIGSARSADPLAAERVIDDLTGRWLSALVDRDDLLREQRRRTVVPIEFDAVGVPAISTFPMRTSTPSERTSARADFLRHKTAPLNLRVSRHASARVNVIFEGLSRDTTYGGHTTILQLAAALAASGVRVRIVATDAATDRGDLVRAARQLDGCSGLVDVECIDATDRLTPIEVGADDRFVATSWWTMYAAHEAAGRLGTSLPLWLVQEYEPLFYPAGSYAAAARNAFSLPHRALVSTSLLAQFLADRSIGAAANDWGTIVFDNALTTTGPPSARSLDRPTPKRILAYLREAPRNLAETVIAALEIADQRGDLPSDWSITGIGGDLTRTARLGLKGGRSIEMFDRLSPGRYRAMLRSHDVGIALQDTPHPGLTSLDMAAAGLAVVTSTCEGKSACALGAISSNILACDPTPESVADALGTQIRRATEYEARADGARFEWPRTAAEAFTPQLVASVIELLDG